MKNKRYIVSRVGDQKIVTVSTASATGIRQRHELRPGPSQKLWNHSPDGFEWGYGGSGPAQLALAILLDHTKDADLSVALHQPFKGEFIATLPKEGGVINAEDIDRFVKFNNKPKDEKDSNSGNS